MTLHLVKSGPYKGTLRLFCRAFSSCTARSALMQISTHSRSHFLLSQLQNGAVRGVCSEVCGSFNDEKIG